MAYKKNDLIKKSIAAIEKHNLFFIYQIVTYLPCNEKTFYNYKLQEIQEIKDALEKNRTVTKQALQKKWFNSDNSTQQLALYKLLANEDELRKLNQSYVESRVEGTVHHSTKELPVNELPKEQKELLFSLNIKQLRNKKNE